MAKYWLNRIHPRKFLDALNICAYQKNPWKRHFANFVFLCGCMSEAPKKTLVRGFLVVGT